MSSAGSASIILLVLVLLQFATLAMAKSGSRGAVAVTSGFLQVYLAATASYLCLVAFVQAGAKVNETHVQHK